MALTNRRILLAITGGIAAYKSAELTRELKTRGADVRVLMTQAAQSFITPLTLQALSGNPVHTELLDPEAEAGMGHIELARWADLMVIAPASADAIARLAQGLGDDLLATVYLASRCPVVVAPAMNQAMWAASATQANMVKLSARAGLSVIGPASGEQACGDVGPGRMEEPGAIAKAVDEAFVDRKLEAKRVVITAGPTYEAIDPVRFIGNRSSGKMGFALAEAARDAGAETTLIAGPVSLPTPDRVNRIDVESAEEMYSASMAHVSADIFIAAAAVADYRPLQCAEQKIKKDQSSMSIELQRNPDIVTSVAASRPRPFVVGFAAETEDVLNYAEQKLRKKSLDMIVVNDVSQQGIGFSSDNNAVTVFWPASGEPGDEHSELLQTTIDIASKSQIARELIGLIADRL